METRATQSKPSVSRPGKLSGYAATFANPATIRDSRGNEFRESIHRNAFDRTLRDQPDIRFLRDHDPASLLGRTKSGTLRVGVDETGLWYDCDLPDTQEARDLVESIRRGDLDSCSFGFSVERDAWIEGDIPTRELRDVSLYECSVVAFPAYEQGTSIAVRSNATAEVPTRKLAALQALRDRA